MSVQQQENDYDDGYGEEEDFYCIDEDDENEKFSETVQSRHRSRHQRPVNGGVTAVTDRDESNGGTAGGGGGGGGQFMGRSTQSAWLRWSHERRESFRRRVESAEKRQSEMERRRVPSPVRKVSVWLLLYGGSTATGPLRQNSVWAVLISNPGGQARSTVGRKKNKVQVEAPFSAIPPFNRWSWV